MDYATDCNGKAFTYGAIVKHSKTGETFQVWGVQHPKPDPPVVALSGDLEVVRPGPLDKHLYRDSKTHSIVWGCNRYDEEDLG